MYSPARSLLTAVILGAVGSIAVASPAAACSVEGWSIRDAARKAAFIAEATVARVEPDGIGLQVHRVLKGRAGGATTVVGTAPDPIPNSSCRGRINVEVGDHVVFALADPATALGNQICHLVDRARWVHRANESGHRRSSDGRAPRLGPTCRSPRYVHHPRRRSGGRSAGPGPHPCRGGCSHRWASRCRSPLPSRGPGDRLTPEAVLYSAADAPVRVAPGMHPRSHGCPDESGTAA